MQTFAQIIAALVAFLGATGYVIVLGAMVLWWRLREAGFSRAVPISFAGREELLVLGGQALAVWAVLLVDLLALVAIAVSARGPNRSIAVAGNVLGVGISGVVLVVLSDVRWEWAVALAVIAGLSVVATVVAGVRARPPWVSWAAALVPAVVGLSLPVVLQMLAEGGAPVATTLAAWVVFLTALIWAPAFAGLRARLATDGAAVERLELDRADVQPAAGAAGAPRNAAELRTINAVLAALRQRLSSTRTRMWLRAIGIGAAGLVVLGGIAVGSQIDRTRLFRSAAVTLKSKSCLTGTYIARNKDALVLGDQRIWAGPDGAKVEDAHNRVLVVRADELMDVQVGDPAAKGVPMAPATCGTPAPGTAKRTP
jgi:hypothetical protein